jgi:hypothetical protein
MVLKCCKEKNIKNLKVDRINYRLKGETPYSLIAQRSTAKIIIKLRSVETEQSKNSTQIEIYDFNDHIVELVPDSSFINSFQKCLETLIPLKSKFELDVTEYKDKDSAIRIKRKKSRQKLFAVILISAFVIIPLASLTTPESNFSKFLAEQEQNQNETFVLGEKQKEAIQIVQNYRGTDGTGSTINEAIVSIILVSYGDADIFDHPSTKYGWDSLRNIESPQVYDVYFHWKSFDGSKSFHFMVDYENNKIWPTDELSSNIINIVNSER